MKFFKKVTEKDLENELLGTLNKIGDKHVRDGEGNLPKEFWFDVRKYLFFVFLKSGGTGTVFFVPLIIYLLGMENYNAVGVWAAVYGLFLLRQYYKAWHIARSYKRNGIEGKKDKKFAKEMEKKHGDHGKM